MKFSLSISLGNEAMQTPEDVSLALSKVVGLLDQSHVTFEDNARGYVRDANGNTVGSWEVSS